MAENQGQTIPAPVNHQPAGLERAQNDVHRNDVQQPGSPMWAPPQPNQQVLANGQPGAVQPGPAFGASTPPPMTFEVPREQLGPGVGGTRSGGFVDKLKTPVAAAVIGGALLLGVGFATGYVVGHDRGAASSSSTSTDGQTGFGGGMGGFGGQMPGGQGQTGQGQTQQGQDGTGASPFGQDQNQQFGPGSQGSQGSDAQDQGGTTTQDGTDLSQTQ